MLRSLLVAGIASVTLALAASPGLAAPQAPAAVREILPDDTRPVAYDIAITPDAQALTFEGQATAEFEVLRPTARVVVNGLGLRVKHATLDGAPVIVTEDAKLQRLTFTAARPLAVGRHKLAVDYAGKIYEQAAGLFAADYRSEAGATQRMLVTQFEPGDARKLAPLWDEPAQKAVFRIQVTAPKGWQAISNMPPASTEPLADGRTRVRFQESPKMSSYLLYLQVGQLDRITTMAGPTEVGVVARAGAGEQGRFALQSSAELLPYYNDYFGAPYPLPKLDNIAAPGAGGFGAMENWGAILYFETYLLLDPKLSSASDKQTVYVVIAHEMAHQWFGDLVTMSWWDDLWLNEGFASWMENKATDHFHPEWKMWLQAAAAREQALALDARASTHPVVQTINNTDEANLAFDAITYQKGQEVIHMLEGYLGEDVFRTGVRRYMARHAYANTVTEDLWRELEAASDAPVSAIARDFLTQPGVPLIRVASSVCQEGRSVVTLSQGRFGVDRGSQAPLTWRVPVTAAAAGGPQAHAVIAGPAPQSLTVEGCGAVKVNVGQTGYFRTVYDAGTRKALVAGFEKLTDADQLGLLGDAYALGEAGEQPFSDYFAFAERVSAKSDPIVQMQVADKLGAVARLYNGLPSGEAFKAYARAQLAPLFATVGWDARPGEAENDSLLRARLVSTLSALDDPAVIAEAQRRYAAYATDPASLPSDLVQPVLSVVAAKADAAMFDGLRAKAKAAKGPTEQRLYLLALAGVNNPVLARRALDLSLTAETPKQLAPEMIRIVAGRHPAMTWSWASGRRAEIDARLDPLQRLDFWPGLMARSNDPKAAALLRDFAAKHLPPSARKPVDETAASLAYRANVRRDRLPELDAWLKDRRS